MGETLVAFKPRAAALSQDRGDGPSAHPYSAHPEQASAITGLQDIRVHLARSDADREQAYRLRYQVYCVENDFEPAAQHRDGRETDPYDAQSVHGLALYRNTDSVAGTARLILPPRKPDGLPLPTPQICSPCVIASNAHRIPAHSTAELSRFAISKSERHRHMARNNATPERVASSTSARQVVSTVSLGLMQAAIAMARTNHITHLYALMEPALLRMLRGLGIHFEKLGPTVEYHGRRQPCFCDLTRLLDTTLVERPDIWAIITDHGKLWPRKPAEVIELRRLMPKPPAAVLALHPA